MLQMCNMKNIIRNLSEREKAVVTLMNEEMSFEHILKELNKWYKTSEEELSAIIDTLVALGLVKEVKD